MEAFEYRKGKIIRFGGKEVDYIVLGKGPLTVFTISLGSPGRVAVSPQHRRLARHTRVVLVRWPGLDHLSEVMEAGFAVLDREGIPNAVWWGASIAGAVSLLAGVRRPERVSGLVIANSALPVPKLAWAVSLARAIVTLLPGQLILRNLTSKMKLDPNSEEAENLRRSLTKQDLLNWLGWAAQYHRLGAGPFESLKASGIPMLIIEGGQDPSVPKASRERLKAFFPDAAVKTFADAGHFPQMTHAEEYERALLTFLKRLKS